MIEIDHSEIIRKITENPSDDEVSKAIQDDANSRVELMKLENLKRRIEELKKAEVEKVKWESTE